MKTRNPILPLDVHIPDPEAHVMPDGRLYVYGSYDARDDMYCSDFHRVASTDDLSSWTVHDIAFSGADVPWFGSKDRESDASARSPPSGKRGALSARQP